MHDRTRWAAGQCRQPSIDRLPQREVRNKKPFTARNGAAIGRDSRGANWAGQGRALLAAACSMEAMEMLAMPGPGLDCLASEGRAPTRGTHHRALRRNPAFRQAWLATMYLAASRAPVRRSFLLTGCPSGRSADEVGL